MLVYRIIVSCVLALPLGEYLQHLAFASEDGMGLSPFFPSSHACSPAFAIACCGCAAMQNLVRDGAINHRRRP